MSDSSWRKVNSSIETTIYIECILVFLIVKKSMLIKMTSPSPWLFEGNHEMGWEKGEILNFDTYSANGKNLLLQSSLS